MSIVLLNSCHYCSIFHPMVIRLLGFISATCYTHSVSQLHLLEQEMIDYQKQ